MGNWYYREVLKMQPQPNGSYGYTEVIGDWEHRRSMAADGLDGFILDGRLVERWAEHLDALRPLVDLCREHLLPTSDFEWMINDYVCDPMRDPDHVEFILYGWHGDELCDPIAVHSVPGGLIVWDIRQPARAAAQEATP